MAQMVICGAMRRLALGAAVAAMCACNLLSGIEDLTADGATTCSGADCPPDGGGPTEEGGGADSPFDTIGIPDVSKDGDDNLPGGYPDVFFGTGGIVGSTTMQKAYAVAVRSDGKIFVLGQAGN